MESLELFAGEVMPEFAERAEERERRKLEELAPDIERALERKKWMRPLEDAEIPEIHALGRKIVEQLPEEQIQSAHTSGSGLSVPLRDPAEG